ncbi:DUF4190 domain-containing protein [Aeromicrobium massiliense]|uniref:DUF4190 domain-containing protein n=1 Tax=Aeromicrobium massiliense TaxID=1464554 RepID=UPI0003138A09|nr:DUF4190 domain-containing protein [Aeromicrobium massiliense]
MTTNEPPYTNDPNQPGGLPPYGSGGDVPPPPPGGGYGYGDGGYGAPPEQNKKALWSMILGIVGLLCCGIAGIVAIVLGNQAKKEIADSAGRQTGEGMAKAGYILGIVAVVLWVVGIILRVAVFAS